MTQTPIDREAVERLAEMWGKRGYVRPHRNPHDYAAPASCAEAMETSDTLRALLAARDADRARIEALEAEVEKLREHCCLADEAREMSIAQSAYMIGQCDAGMDRYRADPRVILSLALAALRDTGNGEGETP